MSDSYNLKYDVSLDRIILVVFLRFFKLIICFLFSFQLNTIFGSHYVREKKNLGRKATGPKVFRASDGGDRGNKDVLEDHENLSSHKTPRNMYELEPFCWILKKRVILEGKMIWKPLGFRKMRRKIPAASRLKTWQNKEKEYGCL